MQEQKRQRLTSGGTNADGRPTTPLNAAEDAANAAAAAAASPGGAAAAGGAPPSPPPAAAAPVLPRTEVIRRLRALGQPATLFGEEDADRQARLVKVEKSVALVDDTRGGQQENVLLMLKRQEKAKAKQAAGDKAAAGGADKASGSRAAQGGAPGEGPSKPKASEGGAAAAADTAAGAGDAGGSAEDALLASFKAAAARVAQQRADEALPVEDRMAKMLKEWCVEWEADLEARPDEVRGRWCCWTGEPARGLVWHTCPCSSSCCSHATAVSHAARDATAVSYAAYENGPSVTVVLVVWHLCASCVHVAPHPALVVVPDSTCTVVAVVADTAAVAAATATATAAGQDVGRRSPGHTGVPAEHDVL